MGELGERGEKDLGSLSTIPMEGTFDDYISTQMPQDAAMDVDKEEELCHGTHTQRMARTG